MLPPHEVVAAAAALGVLDLVQHLELQAAATQGRRAFAWRPGVQRRPELPGAVWGGERTCSAGGRQRTASASSSPALGTMTLPSSWLLSWWLARPTALRLRLCKAAQIEIDVDELLPSAWRQPVAALFTVFLGPRVKLRAAM